MVQLCIRCTRLTVQFDHSLVRGVSRCSTRRFSTATAFRDDDAPSKPRGPRTPIKDTGKSIADAMRSPQSNEPDRPLVIRREFVGGSDQQSQKSSQPPGKLLIRRTQGSGQTTTPQAASAGQQGQLLRRSNGPPQGQLLRRSSGPRAPGAPGRGNQPQKQQTKRRRRPADRQRVDEDEAEFPTEEELDAYITKHIDIPANPTEQITYNPEPQSMIELQKDWPNTPLSNTGLMASLTQQMDWAARRIPHGYQTPRQLAEHYHKGHLTRFESEEEKKAVLDIAADLAKKRADVITEREGEQTAPEDMTTAQVDGKDQKALVGGVINGNYSETRKQEMPFLENIARVLTNNSSYGSAEMDRFMARVQNALPNKGLRKAAPAQKVA